jgi:hypothetical protein
VAVCIGVLPQPLSPPAALLSFVRLASLLRIKQTPQPGNQLFRLELFPSDQTLLAF